MQMNAIKSCDMDFNHSTVVAVGCRRKEIFWSRIISWSCESVKSASFTIPRFPDELFLQEFSINSDSHNSVEKFIIAWLARSEKG